MYGYMDNPEYLISVQDLNKTLLLSWLEVGTHRSGSVCIKRLRIVLIWNQVHPLSVWSYSLWSQWNNWSYISNPILSHLTHTAPKQVRDQMQWPPDRILIRPDRAVERLAERQQNWQTDTQEAQKSPNTGSDPVWSDSLDSIWLPRRRMN